MLDKHFILLCVSFIMLLKGSKCNSFDSPWENVRSLNFTNEEITEYKLWPDGIIPYYIDIVSFEDKVLRDRIRMLLKEVHIVTGIRFDELPIPPINDDSRWVMFINRRGQQDCADHSVQHFTKRGVQKVVLGYECFAMDGELAEAVLSIAGVPAQHNAPNRDEYITVNDENIEPDKKYLFKKLQASDWLFGNMEYDFDSAGHYHPHKYSINGRTTIDPKPNAKVTVINENKALSYLDFAKLRMLYGNIIKAKKNQRCNCDNKIS